MRARLLGFGSLEIDGTTYDDDVVVEGGRVRKRRKGPSKPFRGRYGHTPLSVAEDIPWSGHQLIVGTGYDAALPVLPEVRAEAERRGVDVVAVPTAEACRLIGHLADRDVHAILHVTC